MGSTVVSGVLRRSIRENGKPSNSAISAASPWMRSPSPWTSPRLPSAATCGWRKPGFTRKCKMHSCNLTPRRWTQIEELFHRAAECAPEHRTELLSEACGSDAELRREVEALLSGDENAGGCVQAALLCALDNLIFPLSPA